MRSSGAAPAAVLCIALLLFYGCDKKAGRHAGAESEESIVLLPLQADGSDEVQPLEGAGPNGERPVGASALEGLITEDDARKLRSGRFTAAVCMHFVANDWSQLQVQGIKAALKRYGVSLLAVTDGQLKIDKQIAAHSRRAGQLEQSNRFTEATSEWNNVEALDPGNRLALARLAASGGAGE